MSYYYDYIEPTMTHPVLNTMEYLKLRMESMLNIPKYKNTWKWLTKKHDESMTKNIPFELTMKADGKKFTVQVGINGWNSDRNNTHCDLIGHNGIFYNGYLFNMIPMLCNYDKLQPVVDRLYDVDAKHQRTDTFSPEFEPGDNTHGSYFETNPEIGKLVFYNYHREGIHPDKSQDGTLGASGRGIITDVNDDFILITDVKYLETFIHFVNKDHNPIHSSLVIKEPKYTPNSIWPKLPKAI